MARPQNSTPYSRPVLNHKVTLGSNQMQHVFSRSFNFTSRNLYKLSMVLRRIATEKEASEIEKMVEDDIARTIADINSETERVQKLLGDNGIDAQPSFSHPQELQAEISSQMASRYLDVMVRCDKLLGLLGVAWLSGLAENKYYVAECYRWQRTCLRLGNRIGDITNRSLASARKKGQGDDVDDTHDGDQVDGEAQTPGDEHEAVAEADPDSSDEPAADANLSEDQPGEESRSDAAA